MRWGAFTSRTSTVRTKNRLRSRASPVMVITTNERGQESPTTALLRRTIVVSRLSYNALQRETGVTHAGVMWFVEGRRSLRREIADRLAASFGLALQRRG